MTPFLSTPNSRSRLALILGPFLILLVSLWWWQQDKSLRHIYFTDPESMAIAREQELINNIQVRHDEGDLEREIQLLEQFVAEHPRQTDAWFQLGLGYLETGREDQVIPIMEEIRINDPAFYPDATWYLGLSLMKVNRQEEARRIMQELVDGPDDFYRAKAAIVIDRFL